MRRREGRERKNESIKAHAHIQSYIMYFEIKIILLCYIIIILS